MKMKPIRRFTWTLLLGISSFAFGQAPSVTAPAAATVKQLGAILKVAGDILTLTTDQGTEVTIRIQPGARILRLPPGKTDLKEATLIQSTDLQVKDRVLVRGKLADDSATLNASAVIVMKQQDIAQLQQQELQDWQRRSIGGMVKQVDTNAGSVVLAVGNRTVVVSTTPKTTCKRYAANSIRWQDAVSATLPDIHPGDQLRAKGNKNEDGSQIVAEEIVAGTFRNISGLVTAIDQVQHSLTVQDLATKKSVVVQVTSDSQMKKLPAQLALGLAMRMKGITPPAAPSGVPARSGDLNQILGRLPSASLAELQKGDAIMIVSTEGSAAQPPVVITLLAGVDELLRSKGAESLLTPWSLASAPGGDQQ